MNINAYVGRIASDIELKSTTGGKSVLSFDIAVKRPYSKDVTDFIRCVAWEKNAEFVSRYFKKGQMIAVSGYMTSRKYEDSNGNKRTAFEVICERCEFCESKAAETPAEPTYNPYTAPKFEEVDDGDDVPF